MPKQLTDEQKAAYVAGGGLACPFCGDTGDLNANSGVEVDGGIAWQAIDCLNCGAEWNDVYKLVGIDEEEAVEEDPSLIQPDEIRSDGMMSDDNFWK